MKLKILLIDNVPEFIEIQARLLMQEGYEVSIAPNIFEAEKLLSQDWFHLVVVDQRMEDDDNEHDISGLIFARKKYLQGIPKIILTAYPDYESAVGALGAAKGHSSVLDYVAKQKGPKALSEAIRHIFAYHVRINLALSIDWKDRDSLSLAKLVCPDVVGNQLLNRSEEFIDLFRRIFFEKKHISIKNLLWIRGGRVALIVLVFKEGLNIESYSVVCGEIKSIDDEVTRFIEYAPKSVGEGSTILSESIRRETAHFSANAYKLMGNDLETIQSLLNLYHVGPEKTFNTALTTLYQEALRAWHQDKFIRFRGDSRIVSYAERLRLHAVDPGQIEERFRIIEDLFPTLEVKTSRTTESFSVKFKNQSFSHSNPVPVFSKLVGGEKQEVFITVPGFLSGDNILTDPTGKTWLTDFADAGLAPVLWNYTSMEALIRYDWVDTKDVQRRYELEQCLIQTDFFKPEIRDLDPSLRKPARAIQTIRKLAARAVGKDTLSYHQGMFFHAASRLMEFDPGKPLTNTELARYGHILFSMAMLADLLKESAPDSNEVLSEQDERIQVFDEGARILMIGNRKAHLAPQPFALFKYLYEKPNQLCTKGELLENVLQNKYDERYLHTLIGRIRKVVEIDPEHPRFLFTIQSAGYKLIPKPE